MSEEWWKVPRTCIKCLDTFLPKVGGQEYCEEHRYLAGVQIKAKGSDLEDLSYYELKAKVQALESTLSEANTWGHKYYQKATALEAQLAEALQKLKEMDHG